MTTVRLFRRHLEEQGGPLELGTVRRGDVEAWLTKLAAKGNQPGTLGVRYRGLQAFWRWAVEEELVTASPMVHMHPPKVPERSPAIVTDEELRRLLARTEHDRDFAGRRDAAIIRTFLDSGLRLRELTGLRVKDLDLATGVVVVSPETAKRERERKTWLGPKTLAALDRYLRLRDRHPRAASPGLGSDPRAR